MILLVGNFLQTKGYHLQHIDNIVPRSRSVIHPNCVDLSRRLQDSSQLLLSKHGHTSEPVGRRAEQTELELHSGTSAQPATGA